MTQALSLLLGKIQCKTCRRGGESGRLGSYYCDVEKRFTKMYYYRNCENYSEKGAR